MVQLLKSTIFSVLILLTWPSYLTGASITLKDNYVIIFLFHLKCTYFIISKFQKLMEDKLSRMESKNNQLESQFQQLQEEFATKLIQLESKIQELMQGPSASLKSIQTSNSNNGETYIQSKAMPTSCEDLRLIGHIWSGLYSIMGTQMVETVYCDFTKLTTDPGKFHLLNKCKKILCLNFPRI